MVTKKDKRKAATDAKLFLKEVNRITAKIAKDRDELRALVSDMQDIVDTLTEGAYDFDSAIEHFENGLDEISQYL